MAMNSYRSFLVQVDQCNRFLPDITNYCKRVVMVKKGKSQTVKKFADGANTLQHTVNRVTKMRAAKQ